MNKVVIRIEKLGKLYRIGEEQRYRTLRDTIANVFTLAFRKAKQSSKLKYEASDYIWALKDISFAVKEGEIMGIIGRNGAGKSTLLKILSRITPPTTGYAEVSGSISSLLEVGTGFHPELTGRDNIYFNGAILGMKKQEINRKFDEIVAFAEIEKFMDTPLKHYSSGMYTRLAFAVAAHLEPDILLIDEVLAVGDYEFQKKCFGKMGEVSRQGHTVLLVSHNMPAIMNLCQRAVLLDAGKIVKDGQPSYVVQSYIETIRSTGGEAVWPNQEEAPGNENVRLYAVQVLQDGIEGPTADVDISKEVRIQISYCNLREDVLLYIGILLRDQMGTSVFASLNHKSTSLTEDPWSGRPHPRGLFESICHIPGNFLNEGLYSIGVFIGKGTSDSHFFKDYLVSFQVYDLGEMRKEYFGYWVGAVRPRLSWHTKFLGSSIPVSKETL